MLKLFKLGFDFDHNEDGDNDVSLRKTSFNASTHPLKVEETKIEDDWVKLDAFLLSPEEPVMPTPVA